MNKEEIEKLKSIYNQNKKSSNGYTLDEKFEELKRIENKVGEFPTTGQIEEHTKMSLSAFTKIGRIGEVKRQYDKWKSDNLETENSPE